MDGDSVKALTAKHRIRLKTVTGIYLELRRLILDGTLAPRAILPQTQLTRRLGIGRTPLREALRMLQQEGLITAERNQRARVAAMDPEVLESVYAQRILLSSLGIAVTVNRLSAHELGELDRLLGNMREAGELDELEAWERAHRAFHRGLVEHCGEQLKSAINRLADRSALYRRMWIKSEPYHWAVAAREHEELLKVCRARDAAAATILLARHLERAAITVLERAVPGREPGVVRAAMAMVEGRHPAAVRERPVSLHRRTGTGGSRGA